MVPSRIDLGTIGVEWLTENKNESVNEFVVSKLGHLVESEEKKADPQRRNSIWFWTYRKDSR